MNIRQIFLYIIKQNKIQFLALAFMMVASSIVIFLPAYGIKMLAKHFYAEDMYYYAILFCGFISSMAIAYAIETVIREVIVYNTTYTIMQKLYHEITGKPYEFFLNKNSGVLSSHVNEIARFGGFLLSVMRFVFLIIPTISAIFFLQHVHYALTVFVFIWFVLFSLFMIPLEYKSVKYNGDIMKQNAKFNGNLNEIIKNSITTFSYFNDARERRYNYSFVSKVRSSNNKKLLILVLEELVFITAMISIFAGVVYIIYINKLPLEDLVFCLNNTFGIFWRVTFSFFSIAYINETYGKMKVSVGEIFKRATSKETNLYKNIVFHSPSLEISNVFFQYDESLILKNISLKIKPKQKVAIVGPSGSGKSTMMALMMKLLTPQKGYIKINDSRLDEMHYQDIRQNISFVSQNVQLMSRSIRANISSSYDQDLTDTQLDSICKNAQCYDFIQELPDKYDTILKECGSNLSGGQRQRISIARALAKNGSIVIFDEANSALDNQTNMKFQEAMLKLFKDKTCIFISHKLNNLDQLDNIFFLSEGEIVEFGSHKELISKKGRYHQMYHSEA